MILVSVTMVAIWGKKLVILNDKYVRNKIAGGKQLLNLDQPQCMRLHITLSKTTSEKMVNATREGFVKSTQGYASAIVEKIETFLAWLQ